MPFLAQPAAPKYAFKAFLHARIVPQGMLAGPGLRRASQTAQRSRRARGKARLGRTVRDPDGKPPVCRLQSAAAVGRAPAEGALIRYARMFSALAI